MLLFKVAMLKSDSTYIYILWSKNSADLAKKDMPVVSRHLMLYTASNGTKCRRRHVVAETQKGHLPVSIQSAKLPRRSLSPL